MGKHSQERKMVRSNGPFGDRYMFNGYAGRQYLPPPNTILMLRAWYGTAKGSGYLSLMQTPNELIPSLSRDYNRDPNIRAFERRGVVNHNSTLGI